MTAFTAARTSADQGAERKGPRKAVAFALAGLVAAAGIAGAVVTSSAYFTDTQTVADNYVKTNKIDLEAYGTGGTVTYTAANLTGLVPAQSSNVGTLAKEQSFDLKNVGDGSLTWRINFENLRVTAANGTTALPSASSASQLNLADAKAKLRYQIGYVSGGTTTWKAVFASAPSFTDLTGDELTSTDTGTTNLAPNGVAAIKVRYWLNNDTSSSTADNAAQDLRYTFDLKFDAQQSL